MVRRRLRRAVLLVAAGCLCLAAQGCAMIYWTNLGDGTIGRANLDGTGVNNGFVSGAGATTNPAVNATYIYWGTAGTIARANVDGSGVNPNFISGAGTPGTVTVGGNYIYWGNGANIARANLDGTGVNMSFITGIPGGPYFGSASNAASLAVDGSYIYWANPNAHEVGRASLDGTGVNQSFLSFPPQTNATQYPSSVAVDAKYFYVGITYASNTPTLASNISRTNLDGTGLTQLLTAGQFCVNGGSALYCDPGGLAVDQSRVYVDNYSPQGTGAGLAVANLDGTGASGPDYVTTGLHPIGLAVR